MGVKLQREYFVLTTRRCRASHDTGDVMTTRSRRCHVSFYYERCPVIDSGCVHPCLSMQANVVSVCKVVDGRHINCKRVCVCVTDK